MKIEEETQEKCAKLLDTMLHETPWKDQQWARCALTIAARAIRRGRHLTASEKMANLATAFEEENMSEAAAKLRNRSSQEA